MRDELEVIDQRFFSEIDLDERLLRTDFRGVSASNCLDPVISKAQDIRDGMVDYKVKGKDLRVHHTFWFTEKLSEGGYNRLPVLYIGDKVFYFTSWGFSEMCNKIGMGFTSYMKKCIKNSLIELVVENMSHWLILNAEKEFFVRTYKNEVIGFLSSRYGVFDHTDVLDCVQDSLAEYGNYGLEAYTITPSKLNIRLVDPDRAAVQDGMGKVDDSFVGLVIRNGQTGQASLTVDFLVYTLVCTNGLIVATDRGRMLSRRHLQIERETFTEQLQQVMAEFPEYAAQIKQQMTDARRSRIEPERDGQVLLDRIGRELNLGEADLDELSAIRENHWESTVWGYVGAITQLAQKYHAERQDNMERYAGRLLIQSI